MGDDCFTPCDTDAILDAGMINNNRNNKDAPVKLNIMKLLQKRQVNAAV